MRLTLPYPPSTNNLYATVRGRRIKTACYRDYKREVGQECLAARVRPLEGPLVLTVAIYRPRSGSDLDNSLKALQDSLTGHAYADDSQIVEIHAYRYEDKARPRAEVTIEPFVEPEK